MKLSDLCFLVCDKVNTDSLRSYTYVSTENMLTNKKGIIKASSLPDIEKVNAYDKNDILVSNIRPYFKKIWLSNCVGGCSNDVLVFRAKPTCSPEFLYYILADDNFFNYVTATSKGTKMPRGDKIAIMEYVVPEIPLKQQKKIAAVMSSLDSKIKQNTVINNNLEQQAQNLFKAWLVDFNPFGGTMPKDWRKGCLLDIATYLNGLPMQNFRPDNKIESLPVLKIKELRQGFCDSDSDLCSIDIDKAYIVEDGDVVFSWSGTLLIDLWCGGRAGLNQHLFKVYSDQYEKWFYYSWTKYHLGHFINVAADKATTMGHIKRDELKKAEINLPTNDIYIQLGNLMKPIYDEVITNRLQNRLLSEIRDTLLPKLMSGEIDVSKVDISDPSCLDKSLFSGE